MRLHLKIFSILVATYFSAAKSGLFKTLPEIELPKSFNRKTTLAYIEKIPSPPNKDLGFK
jgi:hypothetical protein